MNGGRGREGILWTAAEAMLATGGRARGDWQATGISIDSRTVEPGDLFVAIQGPSFDGHDFVADAFRKGAAAAIVSRQPNHDVPEAKLLKVGDCLEALRALGGAARSRTRARIIAVTGSVGKTGTKEALRLALGRQFYVFANPGSLNNHWGLPLSLARLPHDVDFGVFEMGMNHPGEISPLTRLARPHVALVTTVEPVHTEFFSSVEEIADAKAEIFEGVASNGAAVLNRDNPHFHRLAAAAERAGVSRIYSFGLHRDASVRALRTVFYPGGSEVTAALGSKTLKFRIGTPGRHWVSNAMAVLAAVWAAEGDIALAAAALGELEAPKGRGRVYRVHTSEGSIDLIDESYNASPVSMRAALEVLAQVEPRGYGRRIAVLGDMLELGPKSAEMHAGLAGALIDGGIEKVFTAGENMAHLWDLLPRDIRGGHADNSAALVPVVLANVQPGDVVMVKGSAGSRTGLIVEALRGLGDMGEAGDVAQAGGRE